MLSGGPASVTTKARRGRRKACSAAACRSFDLLWPADDGRQLGGVVEGGHAAEFGRAEVDIKEATALFEGVWQVGKR